MTRRCDSNPAQYERNRRFGHLVYVLGRSAGGAKLPSVGLCLNASKAESRLVTATISLDLLPCSGKDSLRTPTRSREPCCSAQSAVRLSRSLTWQGGGPKSSVDDLCTGRGVVLGRAATTLRSIETQPFWLDDLSCQLDKSSSLGFACFLACLLVGAAVESSSLGSPLLPLFLSSFSKAPRK